MTVWPAMGDAPEMTTYEADRGAVPEPVVVHVKSTATDMFGEESLCFVACNQNPSSVADSKCFGKACTVIARFVLLRHIDGEEVVCSFQVLWPKRLQVFWNVFPESCALHRTEIEHQFASSVRAECAVAVTFQEWGITMVSKDYAKALDLPGLFNFAECSTNNDDQGRESIHEGRSWIDD
ncbi:uncharacterized protein NECHADRAFT_88503 [Fusarium vanettenii 77-13-4]|uniref:Uncharacterized protein n=1 Tax=Fusarium vanettenii (strain ATCC MYA-4622 / CBS 123669 / FGSC 9596 / NRRL 45880 / 77-13-4) TaxID=660122 RepID=C7ZBR6_FUSV7|nr:uncharacterized protein NECHADRAFT_88503 [Fusarium vanettenii 77-13-4]EEU38608.1 predicted protein [Fusarium vanettenii 77-13-4]